MNYTKISRRISYSLRHNPYSIKLHIDKHGWAPVSDLILALGITMEDLEHIVYTDNKSRYSFNENKSKIRANQGHSIPVDLELKPMQPPDILYHGIAQQFIENIFSHGISKMSRQYVHLSTNPDQALSVGKRHGEPIILVINSKEMYNNGYRFYLSENKIWLTDNVPVKYISKYN